MRREDMADLAAFAAVAEARSFTGAARRLGLSQSALSQIVGRLEGRLDVRLLARTTRSVAPTEAGEQLLATLRPALEELDAALERVVQSRERVSGTVRISSVEHAARTVLLPKLMGVLAEHPGIRLEIVSDYALVDIVSERFDAGVRLGDQVEKDMIGVRLSSEIPMAIVGSPEHFARHRPPREPGELTAERCIGLRLPSSKTLNAWRLRKGRRRMRVRVDGPLVLDSIELILDAALAGAGLAYLPLDTVAEHLEHARLVQILERETEPLPGYHLYYPHRRRTSLAFRLVVEALRSSSARSSRARSRRSPSGSGSRS